MAGIWGDINGSQTIGANQALRRNAADNGWEPFTPSGGAYSAGVSTDGNTAGATGTVSNQLVLAGGNNITLSQTTGAGGATVTIVGGAGGGGGAGTNTFGMSNLGNTAGISGAVSGSQVAMYFAGGNNVTLSQSLNGSSGTITISAGAGGGGDPNVSGSYFDNMLQQNSVQAITYTSVSTGLFGRVVLQPLTPANEWFPYHITASTALLGFSNSGSSSISGAFSSSWYLGIYTRNNSTQLSLLNSVSTSYGLAAATNNSASFNGARWMSFDASQWSSSPVFVQGSRYFFAFLARTSGTYYASHSLGGMHLGASAQRSGYMAAVAASNTSSNAWHPFMGVHSLTTHTALPPTLANSEINKASVYANFVPQFIINAGFGVIH